MVAIVDLTRNPYQPRQNFKEEKLEELANSIKKNEVIQLWLSGLANRDQKNTRS